MWKQFWISTFIILKINKKKIIPKPIEKLMPKLKLKEYLNLKNDPNFRDKKASVCENCLLKIIKIIENMDKITKEENEKFKVTKYLDPFKTKERYLVISLYLEYFGLN